VQRGADHLHGVVRLTTRIGVVSDTHCPEFLDRLPGRLFETLRGVELILHAGDVNRPETIAELARIAPVEAIRGDHDGTLATLPLSREITVEGRRIVLVHGHRSRWLEEPQTLLWTLTLGYFHPHAGLPRALWRRFPGADVIVFGHTHRPHLETRNGTLLFNPGGVHQWNPTTAARRLRQKPGWFEWSWLQVARHMRAYPVPSVGILEISRSAIVPTVVQL
jgi:putative phosphoesterase